MTATSTRNDLIGIVADALFNHRFSTEPKLRGGAEGSLKPIYWANATAAIEALEKANALVLSKTKGK